MRFDGTVMPAHSRLKNGVASARLCRRTASLPLAYVEERRRFRSPMPKNGVASVRLSAGIHVLIPRQNKDVDGRNPSPPRLRRGHDLTRPAEAQAKAASPA